MSSSGIPATSLTKGKGKSANLGSGKSQLSQSQSLVILATPPPPSQRQFSYPLTPVSASPSTSRFTPLLQSTPFTTPQKRQKSPPKKKSPAKRQQKKKLGATERMLIGDRDSDETDNEAADNGQGADDDDDDEGKVNPLGAQPMPTTRYWTVAELMSWMQFLQQSPNGQVALLPGRLTKRQEKEQKINKATWHRQVAKWIWGARDPNLVLRVKNKIPSLMSSYRALKARLGETGAGLLFSETQQDTPLYSVREAIQKEAPWFEALHEMLIDRPEVQPVRIFASGQIDGSLANPMDEQEEQQQTTFDQESFATESHGDDDDDKSDAGRNGRGVPQLETIMEEAEEDPLARNVIASGTGGRTKRPGRYHSDDDDDNDDSEDPDAVGAGRRPRVRSGSGSGSRSRSASRNGDKATPAPAGTRGSVEPRQSAARPTPKTRRETQEASMLSSMGQFIKEAKESTNEARLKIAQEKTKRTRMRIDAELADKKSAREHKLKMMELRVREKELDLEKASRETSSARSREQEDIANRTAAHVNGFEAGIRYTQFQPQTQSSQVQPGLY